MICPSRPLTDGTPESFSRLTEHESSCEICGGTLRSLDGPASKPAAHTAGPGQLFGRYLILDRIGRGGMGTVFAAYDPPLDRKVALKLVEGDPTSGGLELGGLREPQALARLSHPNIVAVYDAGTIDGQVFIAMELVDGTTLRAWCAQSPRSWRTVVETFLEAAKGMVAIHEAGLVHLDFKPENVLIDRHGGVRITDFGLARVHGARASREGPGVPLPGRSLVGGTPGYMAPEQWVGLAADARSDQFAFCAALFEALYGQLPYGQGSLVNAPGAPKVPDAKKAPPGWLKRVLLQGLSPRPEDRFASMESLAAALEKGARRRARALLPVAVAGLIIAVSISAVVRERGARGAAVLQTERAVRFKLALDLNARLAEKNVESYCAESARLSAVFPRLEGPHQHNAAAFLVPRVRLESEPDAMGSLAPPAALVARMTTASDAGVPGWLTNFSREDLASIDFGWLDELAAFDHWWRSADPRATQPGWGFEAKIPLFSWFVTWARLRLARAAFDDDLPKAVSQLEHARQLLRTVGVLMAELVSVQILTAERQAIEDARVHGRDTTALTPPPDLELKDLRSLLFASTTYAWPGVAPVVMERAWSCSLSPCTMLTEAALYYPIAATEAPDVSRATFDSLVERSQCDRELIMRVSRQQGGPGQITPETLFDDPLKRTYNKL